MIILILNLWHLFQKEEVNMDGKRFQKKNMKLIMIELLPIIKDHLYSLYQHIIIKSSILIRNIMLMILIGMILKMNLIIIENKLKNKFKLMIQILLLLILIYMVTIKSQL